MSAFQDFGPLSERRRAEKQQTQRKRLMIAGASVSVMLVLAVVGVATSLYHSKNPVEIASDNDDRTSQPKELRSSAKYIKTMCSATEFKETCESSLSNAVSSAKSSNPKEIVRAAVAVIAGAAERGFNHSESFISSDNPRVKSAISLCKSLFGQAYDELKMALSRIDLTKFENLPSHKSYIKNWLSAALHYQEMCVDAFPDGEEKAKMKEAMKTGKQLTSNALAIVGATSKFLTALGAIDRFDERNLAENVGSEAHKTGDDGLPNWIAEESRRHLREKAQNLLKPNVTVAKDGSADFNTINDALNAMPKKYIGRYVIYVKAGIYEEHVVMGKEKVNVTIYGDGSQKSVVTGSLNWVDGVQTSQTATFAAMGFGLMLIGMGFRNTAGPEKHQAVALRIQSDNAVILNCRMEAFQDTLYAQAHYQFYRSCVISGTVDFIFGDATAVFQNCLILLRRPLDNQQNIITAHGRAVRFEDTAFVLQNCRINADTALTASDKPPIRSYLGRPWKEYSRAIFMESEIGDFINPDGYMPWEGDFALSTLFYAEYNNRGAGADTSRRVRWGGVKVLTKEQATAWTIPRVYGIDDFIMGISGNLAQVRKGLTMA